MAQILLFTQETCGACAMQREKSDGFEEAIEDPTQQSTGPTQRLVDIVRG
ncbi:hypothetical protein [Natrinema halophilum]|uniref:Uncharacterized protein n=1 Tax=Natrinema halophilum TaxID=1699371 RepID=A0A7D5KFC6_9EURY|nr:hypothetical protein [Natrinema halophilum]QLG51056.1 hypothetical protein HYG82_20590 [Natrinema halophilum]